MQKLKSIKDFEILANEISTGNSGIQNQIQIKIAMATCAIASGSSNTMADFHNAVKEHKLDNVTISQTGCMGYCYAEPTVEVILPGRDGIVFSNVDKPGVDSIVRDYILKGNSGKGTLIEKEYTSVSELIKTGADPAKKQIRIALRNCDFIDPESIGQYILNDGYKALKETLSSKSPDDVIGIIKKSGLRGRGGGGFPTGLKWELAKKSLSDKKYVVCNADEGDPGAFMDRAILEGDPHSILEAMAICGFAIGSDHGLIYIRAEYPLAIKRLRKAIADAVEFGLLGEDILGTGFDFNIEIKYGAGAFVCGEETALIHSMEGQRGEPTTRPPFPAQSGYNSKPTNVNNVETFANVPVIILHGPEFFASIGTEKSKGTKVFALAGKIKNVGLIEVPMGIPLKEVIFDIGNGIKNNKEFKAVQTGGPSGGCLTVKHLETPIDYDNLIAAGSMMGSGGMIVMDEDDCMPAVARFYLDFVVDESCGKCTPCREGTKRLCEILDKIIQGRANENDLETLNELSSVIKDSSLCGLGQTAPNPVLSTLSNFHDEYLAHVIDKRCPAGKCKELLHYEIDPVKCVGCTACAKACPVGAIDGKVKEIHFIRQDACIKCNKCFEVCKFAAVIKR